MTTAIIGILLLAALCFFSMRAFAWRSAMDVLADLDPGEPHARESEEPRLSGAAAPVKDSIANLSEVEQRRLKRLCYIAPLGAALAAFLLSYFIARASLPSTLIGEMVGLCLGYLYAKSAARKAIGAYHAQLEFSLPIVMERVVMAVQSGFDVIAALRRVVELETEQLGATGPSAQLDPVTRLIAKVCSLCDAGMDFKKALNQVAAMSSNTAIKHAFVHLGLAYEQGGELVMPLSELSDSTQLYYQDSVEEQIAKMPVRATLPLVVTFCGLIVFFLSSPILQVVNMLATSLTQLEEARK